MSTYGQDASELTTADVLKRDIAWDTYLNARLISEKDLQLIRRYDKRNPDTQQDLLNEVRIMLIYAIPIECVSTAHLENWPALSTLLRPTLPIQHSAFLLGLDNSLWLQAGPSYAEAFLTVLHTVTKEDTVQYVLALLDQLLAGAVRGCFDIVSICSVNTTTGLLETPVCVTMQLTQSGHHTSTRPAALKTARIRTPYSSG